ncbi:hypothetical protein [Labilithrix luteola]|nr:hypothetical protein [Labilithrix luteola]
MMSSAALDSDDPSPAPSSHPRLRVARLGAVVVLALAGGCSSSSGEVASPSASPPPGEPSVEPTDPGPSTQGPARAQENDPPKNCAPASNPADGTDVTVTVRTNVGPHGASAPVSTDRRLYGMNIADWVPEDYSPNIGPAYLALLRALNPGVLRWPAGHRSQEYRWSRGGDGQRGNWTLYPADVDAFMGLVHAAGTEPLIGINVKTGTPAAAQDLVRYLNIEKGYGVRYFQIGNEPDLVDGITPSPEVYADELIAFTDAMRAVDPSIRVIGPELLTGAHVGGMQGTRDWMTPILGRAGDRIDGISWHYYPLDSGQPSPTSGATLTEAHLFQESADDWRPAGLAFADEVMPALASLRNKYAPHAEIWITELGEDPGPAAGLGLSDTLAAGLWVGDVLGRYAEYGPGAVFRWIFKSGPEHGYSLLDPNDRPKAAYGAYWLYAAHFGDRFVDSESSALTQVAVHAALRSDGAVTVALVNKSIESRKVHLALDGACVSSASQLTLSGPSLSGGSFDVNGRSLTADTASAGIEPASVSSDVLFDTELPPSSMRVLVYRP